MQLRRASCYLLATVALNICAFLDSVTAQISSDGSLSTTVSTDDAVNFLIENGDRSGDNLFHSFSEFSIPNLGSAYFDNATDITNIFSRVTGGNISDIQGLIRANGTANLFLINPAGIVFGENASLDVGGSFFATTGSSVVFGDGIEFSATEPQEAPLLTVNITPGLQMGANPLPIDVSGSNLAVNSGQSISLLGGDVVISNSIISAPGGQINLGGLAETVIIPIEGLTVTFPENTTFGNVILSDAAFVDVTSSNSGSIAVNAADFTMSGSSQLLAGLTFGGNTANTTEGSITINATKNTTVTSLSIINSFVLDGAVGSGANIEISTGNLLISEGSQINNFTFGEGNAGDINIETEYLQLLDGGIIGSLTFADGNSGNVTVRASESLELNSLDEQSFPSGIFLQALPGSTGNVGSLLIETARLYALNGGQIATSTFASGNSGDLIVKASESVEVADINDFGIASGLFVNAQPGSTGNSGNLSIETDYLQVAQGARIAASTLGDGNAGNLIIQANKIDISEAIADFGGEISGVTVAVNPDARGNGGDLTINAQELNIFNGGQVIASTLGDGDAGDINLTVDEINLYGISEDNLFPSRVAALSENNFAAGSVNLNTNNLSVRDRAQISVSNTGTGNAGNLNINAGNIFLDTQGSLQGEVAVGDQGNINLTSQLLLLRSNSSITTNAGNQATGGNITIDTVNLVALEDSDITANAIQGQGGNILVTAQGLFLSPDSQITASSEFGVDGIVTLNTPQEDNSAAILELPTTFTDPSQQIAQGCAWTTTSSFYVTGRGGIPQDPSAILPANDILSDVRTSPNPPSSVVTENSSENQSTIIEANAWIINSEGNVELVAIVPNNNQNLGQVASSCSGEVDS